MRESRKKQEEAIKHEVSPNKTVLEKDAEVLAYYNKNKGNYISSKSSGAVSNGKMTNGKLLPFYGENFTYFDKGSYTQTK